MIFKHKRIIDKLNRKRYEAYAPWWLWVGMLVIAFLLIRV